MNFTKHRTYLISVATLYMGNRTDAEDVVQETFLKAYKNKEQYDNKEKELRWLMSIMLNTVRDVKRKEKREKKMRSKYKYLRCIEEDEGKIIKKIRGMIKQLPKHQREITGLHLLEGKSYAQIAEELNMNPNTVRGKVTRAKKRITEMMEEV